MTTDQLINTIKKLEQYISTCSIKNNTTALQSILDNYKELLKYKQKLLVLSPVTVGDTIYAVLVDEFLKPDDYVECYEIESISIYRESTLLKYYHDDVTDVICDLESLINNQPYCGRYIFTDEKKAQTALQNARKRLGYEEKQ